MSTGTIYLLPSELDTAATHLHIPDYNIGIIKKIKTFIVENERTSRRFLKKIYKEIEISELNFISLNKHSTKDEMNNFLQDVYSGRDIGILSEAGCPTIAILVHR